MTFITNHFKLGHLIYFFLHTYWVTSHFLKYKDQFNENETINKTGHFCVLCRTASFYQLRKFDHDQVRTLECQTLSK